MKRILITGANRGIGLELVKQYLAAGWHVDGCYRDKKASNSLFELAAEKKQSLTLHELDVLDEKAIQALGEHLKNQPIDILFNNAGVSAKNLREFGSIHDTENACEVFKINTIAPLLMAQALLESVEKSEKKLIINMSSEMGSIAQNVNGNYYVYRASKSALNAITKSLAIDLKRRGITVISMNPGWVRTDMGGEQAPLDVISSVRGMREVIERVDIKSTGGFLGYDGGEMPW
ncbi:short-chain dehydrogenase [Coxiella burnetii]|uniref:SDR family oxidoreductase n=1 Tax=Coxiella burnetii TaxID=777 RepID=UPI0000DAE9A5|nr:SDR family oxidoreductase [Coxiella burnetii]ABX77404.1 oxidoreductase, short chain dehydrogenase/reductase family [Coxiella burnetii RSA 331]AML49253.1 short-chain dehydrogenase [Coxiella burnetii]AML55188.1 short-chain dehydrogenase [Coxiella burnetii]ATN69168.1 short-chain dehydrogenase [Coxiella burnetii]ATN71084.1 short-chain dehydrogenase [Coxiella burnetii]